MQMHAFIRPSCIIANSSVSYIFNLLSRRQVFSVSSYRQFRSFRVCRFSCESSFSNHNRNLKMSMPTKEDQDAKKFKADLNGQSALKKVGTHDGTFHCDEVLAVFLLKQLPEYENAEIVRSRDSERLKTCDVVVDVGGVYDPNTFRFDHHQKEFAESMSTIQKDKPWTTKLSSAGLVYAHFGEAILAKLLAMDKCDDMVQSIYDKMYENFVEEIDATDNGISQNDEPVRYVISTNLGSRVGHLNPSWRSKLDSSEGFQKALALVGGEFLGRLEFYSKDWWEAYSVVKNAVESRFEVDPSGEIISLAVSGCPWKDHLLTLETKLDIPRPIQFALYTDENGLWRVQGVPVTRGSFTCRTFLHEKWRGVRDKALELVSGIPGISFVHANGFIGGAKNMETAIKMAKLSIEKNRTDTDVNINTL